MFLVEIDNLILIEDNKVRAFSAQEVATKLIALKTLHPTYRVSFRELELDESLELDNGWFVKGPRRPRRNSSNKMQDVQSESSDQEADRGLSSQAMV